MQALLLQPRSFREPQPVKNGVFQRNKSTSDYFGYSEESLHSLRTTLESSFHVDFNSENKNQKFGKCSVKKDVTFEKVRETQLENYRGVCKGSKISPQLQNELENVSTFKWFGASSKVRHFLHFSFRK